MKKLFLFVFWLFVFLFFWTFVQANNIWDISVEFCNWENNTKSLSMVLDSGKEWEICMEFSNYSDNDVNINYWFVDGVVTADKYKSKACKNEWDKQNFGQYVKQDITSINIPSKTKVKQKSYIKFPAGFTGMVNWCLTYFVSADTTTTNVESAMFDVLVRKASFIDVLVWWKLSRNLKLSSENDAIKSFYDKQKKALVLEVVLDNAGTVNEWAVMDVEVSNIFGYNSLVSGEVIKVLSDDKSVLRMEVKNIPWYRWPFDISLNILSTPNFDFDSASIPNEMKEEINIKAKTSVFIFPWIPLYIFVWIIVLIILIRLLSKHLKFQ